MNGDLAPAAKTAMRVSQLTALLWELIVRYIHGKIWEDDLVLRAEAVDEPQSVLDLCSQLNLGFLLIQLA